MYQSFILIYITSFFEGVSKIFYQREDILFIAEFKETRLKYHSPLLDNLPRLPDSNCAGRRLR